MDVKHLKLTRSLPCIICGKWPPNQAHHLLRSVRRGMALKAQDRYTLPLCFNCHRDLHDMGDETLFFEQHNIDAVSLSDTLYEYSLVKDPQGAFDYIEARFTPAWEAFHHRKTLVLEGKEHADMF